jgi:undecaprenyl pyrophosphate phosphatase UppP
MSIDTWRFHDDELVAIADGLGALPGRSRSGERLLAEVRAATAARVRKEEGE